MTNPAAGLIPPPAALNAGRPSRHGCCRGGSQSMKASPGKPQQLTTARRCRQGTGRGGRARAGSRVRQVASLRAGAGSPLPQPAFVAGSSQPGPASGSACRCACAAAQGLPALRCPALKATAGPLPQAAGPGGAARGRVGTAASGSRPALHHWHRWPRQRKSRAPGTPGTRGR